MAGHWNDGGDDDGDDGVRLVGDAAAAADAERKTWK